MARAQRGKKAQTLHLVTARCAFEKNSHKKIPTPRWAPEQITRLGGSMILELTSQIGVRCVLHAWLKPHQIGIVNFECGIPGTDGAIQHLRIHVPQFLLPFCLRTI